MNRTGYSPAFAGASPTTRAVHSFAGISTLSSTELDPFRSFSVGQPRQDWLRRRVTDAGRPVGAEELPITSRSFIAHPQRLEPITQMPHG